MHSRAHSPGLRSPTDGLSSIGSLNKAHGGICPEKLAPVTPISLRTFARLVFRLFSLTVLSLITLGLSPKIALPGGSSSYRRLTGRFGRGRSAFSAHAGADRIGEHVVHFA